MRYTVYIHEQAKQDIRRNATWWAENHSSSQADRWFHTAFDEIERLVNMPESHPLAAEHGDFSFELRELQFGFGSRPGFRALFVIRNDTVHVLAVRRAAQDRFMRGSLPVDFE